MDDVASNLDYLNDVRNTQMFQTAHFEYYDDAL